MLSEPRHKSVGKHTQSDVRVGARDSNREHASHKVSAVKIRFEFAVGAFDLYCSELQLVSGEHWISLVKVGVETSYCVESQVGNAHSRVDFKVGATTSI
jgi:hypothetical protein